MFKVYGLQGPLKRHELLYVIAVNSYEPIANFRDKFFRTPEGLRLGATTFLSGGRGARIFTQFSQIHEAFLPIVDLQT